MDKKLKEQQLTDEILELIDNKGNYTRSDLQARIQAIIMEALNS